MNNYNPERIQELIKSIETQKPELYAAIKQLQTADTISYMGQTYTQEQIEELYKLIPGYNAGEMTANQQGNKAKDDIEKKWEIIKQRDPRMKGITIFNNHNLEFNKQEPFISIRTSDGKNHLYKIDGDFDFFDFYNTQLQNMNGNDFSLDALVNNFKFIELEIKPAEQIIADPQVNQNIKTQLQEYITMYSGKPNISVTANITEDIIYINDSLNPDNNYIVTYTIDINNDLEAVKHGQNVFSETTTKQEALQTPNATPKVIETATSNTVDPQIILYNPQYQNPQAIISNQEFLSLFTKGNFSEIESQQISAYLDHAQAMIEQKDPKVPEIIANVENSLSTFNAFDHPKGEIEASLIHKADEIINSYQKSQGNDLSKGPVLTFFSEAHGRSSTNPEEDSSSGYLNIVSIFIIVAALVIGLSIFALYIINS